MRVHLVQLDIVWHDSPANRRRVDSLLEAGDVRHGDLVVLPEMFASGFTMDLAASTTDAATYAWCSELARRYRCHLLAGLVRQSHHGKGRNLAVLFAPDGSEVACYQKVHPFFANEAGCYEPGRDVVVVSMNDWQLAPFVCYDLRFPELFRVASARGAELMVVIANWPIARVEHWLTLLRARAIENQAYVVGVNRVGRDPELVYPGRSVVVDPLGVVIADAGAEQRVLTAKLDRSLLLEWRERFPVLADRRLRDPG
jgi:predicted amidohydrolase